MIAHGLTNRDIARELLVSINTVKTHRFNLYQKLSLNSRADLVDYAIKHGFLHG